MARACTRETTTKKIGKYEILRELGRGAMGVVFKARDPLIGRLVALKTIALAASQSEDLRQRFYREAQAAGGLQHPNIVTVYEMGEEDGVPFIAMEYLEGENLDAVLSKNTQIPLAQKLGYLVQVCRALSYAHRHGIVHRDIKPGNIVVTRDGTVKVVDFGIARMMDTSKTQTGVLLGTLAYMSPQLVKGERADERADIWALGVVSYELFAGGLKPFDGENHAALLLSIVSDEPRPLSKFASDCPEELRRVVEKMLQKKVEDRYQSFEQLLATIEPIWRRHQREWVDFLLAQSRDLVSKGELPAARKILLQARLVDGTRTVTREMLETVNAALKDKLLPAEVEEHLDRSRSLRAEGSLEEARAEAKSALELDSRSESARLLLGEITREIELLQDMKKGQRASALERLLAAMRAAIHQGKSSEAIRIGREALGRAGEDPRVSELIVLAEHKLREQGQGAAPKRPPAAADLEVQLYSDADESENLIREYVFERVGPNLEKSGSSLPRVAPRDLQATQRVADSRLDFQPAVTRVSVEGAAHKEQLQRSGTIALPDSAGLPQAETRRIKPLLYVAFVAVVGGIALAAIGWKRSHTPAVQIASPPAKLEAAQQRQKEPSSLPGEVSREAASIAPAKKAEDDRVIAATGPQRVKAEQLRDAPSQRAGKNDQNLQANQRVSALESAARHDLDAGDAAAAREKLSEIHSLGGNDPNLAAEITRTERAHFAALESEYQQDAQSVDDQASIHLGDLQRRFRALAARGGPMADSARNYAETLIPAKIAEMAAKAAAAKKDAAQSAQNQEFDNAVKDYKRFLEARDANSLKSIALPKFQAIAQSGTGHAAEASQYIDRFIPAAIRQLAPFPVIGCAESPAGLKPSVKVGDLVACGLLDEPRLKWVQFTWPEFPPRAKQASQVKGVAMLMLTVDEQGDILEAKPRGPSDPFGFVDAAMAVARSWKTNPPRAQGKPVRTQFSVDVSFSFD